MRIKLSETDCVYCAVRAGSFCSIRIYFGLWQAKNSPSYTSPAASLFTVLCLITYGDNIFVYVHIETFRYTCFCLCLKTLYQVNAHSEQNYICSCVIWWRSIYLIFCLRIMLEAQSYLSQILTCREEDDRVKLFVRADIFLCCRVPPVFGAHWAFCLSEYKGSITVKHNSVVLVVDAAWFGSTNHHWAILYNN
jgi:hypothetical protein